MDKRTLNEKVRDIRIQIESREERIENYRRSIRVCRAQIRKRQEEIKNLKAKRHKLIFESIEEGPVEHCVAAKRQSSTSEKEAHNRRLSANEECSEPQ